MLGYGTTGEQGVYSTSNTDSPKTRCEKYNFWRENQDNSMFKVEQHVTIAVKFHHYVLVHAMMIWIS
jgi:hypothetical protein